MAVAVAEATKPQGNAELTRNAPTFRPLVDIVEAQDELLVFADVPGTRGEDLEIDFDKGTLTIHAKVADRTEKNGYLVREYGVGDFHRVFQVGEAIDAARITAELTNGVLTLHLPKIEAVKPRKIAVKTE